MTCYGVSGNFEGNIMRFVIALAFIFLVSGYGRADCRAGATITLIKRLVRINS
jgi:hypothetical protein